MTDSASAAPKVHDTKIVPSDDDLRVALLDLKSQNSSLGIIKTHALLLSTHPIWSVSEKRVRKVLQAGGQIPPTVTPPQKTKGKLYPSSRVIEKLDVNKWTAKVQVRYFDKQKGKGLVAKEKIAEGEIVWKEDPFVLAPEWDIYDLQQASRACGYCSTLLSTHTTLPCQASSSNTPCPAKFCNRLCLSRSSKTHPLLCPAQNPASVILLSFARKNQWMALHALAQITSRVLLAAQAGEEAFEADWSVVQGLAVLGMEERSQDIMPGGEPDRATWRKAYQLYLQAFRDPPAPIDKKKLAKILRKQVRDEIEKGLFEYNSFLRGLGSMSLNLEAHGGLYTLHSHLNHSCTPNISVRHFDHRIALSRITLVAKKDIEVGEELVVTYVDPGLGQKARRNLLKSWGFGICMCERCVGEEMLVKEQDVVSEGMEDLEQELKAGLGVI